MQKLSGGQNTPLQLSHIPFDAKNSTDKKVYSS